MENHISNIIYKPLHTRLASIFIETKTSSDNIDTTNIQLSIWAAAWYKCIHSIITLRGGIDKIITIPVIQVVSSVQTLLFIIDTGAEVIYYYTLYLSQLNYLTMENSICLVGTFRQIIPTAFLVFTSCKLLYLRLPTRPRIYLIVYCHSDSRNQISALIVTKRTSIN